MALIRTITVGYRTTGNKVEKIKVSVPADWIAGDKDALSEVTENEKIRTRISFAPDQAVCAEISDPWDPADDDPIMMI